MKENSWMINKRDSIEFKSIETAGYFITQAVRSLNKLEFDDYLEYIDSYNLECQYLDNMSIEGGCEYWSLYGREFAALYYYHATAFCLSGLYKIFKGEADDFTVSDSQAMIFLMMEQVEFFLTHQEPKQVVDYQFISKQRQALCNKLEQAYQKVYGL